MELDALEAVRRLTLERDALAERVEHLKSDMEKKQEFVNRVCNERDVLANELDAVKDDFRVSLQTLDSIRAATGLCDYGHHLAESLKAMKEDRDALAEQVKRLEGPNGATRGCMVPSWGKIARDVIWCASLALQNEIRLADARKDWDKLRRLQKGKMALDRIRDELSNGDLEAK